MNKGGRFSLRLLATAHLCLCAIVFTSPFGSSPLTAQTSTQTIKRPPQPVGTIATIQLRKVIGSDSFANLVASAYNGAYFMVNSCGGTDSSRLSKIFVSGVYQSEEPLARLDAQLPPGVLLETVRQQITFSGEGDFVRDARLRACVDANRTYQWKGAIEGGKFKVSMQFNSNVFVKTRMMIQKKVSNGWQDHWDWNSVDADKNTPDYVYVAPSLNVYLSPVLQGGKLSYAQVEVKWSWFQDLGFYWPQGALVKDPFATPFGHPLEKSMILHYKSQAMDQLAARMTNAFNSLSVKNHLTNLLTNSVKTGDLAMREISTVSGSGAIVTVQFK